MEVYQQIIKDEASDRRYVAEAYFRLGKCYLNKGERDKAAEQFQQVVARYGDQEGVAAAAKKELEKLAPAAGSSAALARAGAIGVQLARLERELRQLLVTYNDAHPNATRTPRFDQVPSGGAGGPRPDSGRERSSRTRQRSARRD